MIPDLRCHNCACSRWFFRRLFHHPSTTKVEDFLPLQTTVINRLFGWCLNPDICQPLLKPLISEAFQVRISIHSCPQRTQLGEAQMGLSKNAGLQVMAIDTFGCLFGDLNLEKPLMFRQFQKESKLSFVSRHFFRLSWAEPYDFFKHFQTTSVLQHFSPWFPLSSAYQLPSGKLT